VTSVLTEMMLYPSKFRDENGSHQGARKYFRYAATQSVAISFCA
jgi:hypothetical protein